MAVDHVGWYAGSWSYIQGSTLNHENDGKINKHEWMLDLVYDVLGVNFTRCMLCSRYTVVGGCYTRCQLMTMAWQDREEWHNFVFCDDSLVEDKKERDRGWRRQWCGGYERLWDIRGTACLIWLARPHIGVITLQIGTHTCNIRECKLSRTRCSHMSQFPMIISPISFHHSLSRPQLYHHLTIRS